MLGRIILFILGVSIAYSINAAASPTSTVWQIGEDNKDSFTLVDDEKTLGEEVIQLNINAEVKTIKVQDVSIESYGGSFFLADAQGTILEDLSVEAVFKTRFEQILQLLTDETFRKAFEEIPESCTKEANGFLIITDNLAGKAYGYCLTPN